MQPWYFISWLFEYLRTIIGVNCLFIGQLVSGPCVLIGLVEYPD